MPMLRLLIHMKLGYMWGERLGSFLQSSWLQARGPYLCAWEMDGSRVTMPGQLCSGGSAGGAGLGPGYGEFHDPDIMNFCRLGY